MVFGTKLEAIQFPISLSSTTISSDRLLRSLVNLSNKHLRLAQVRRMSRAAPFHLRFGARCEHLLVLRGSTPIVFADEVGRWNIAPGGVSELGSLHLMRLCDKSRGPQRCLPWLEIVVERLIAMQDIEAAIGLNTCMSLISGGIEHTYSDVIVWRFAKGTQDRLALLEQERSIKEEMNDASG